jgi:hypothetical protein
MDGLQAFQTAARKGGFVEMNESADRGVLWLKRNALDTTQETHQLMCIDSLRNNATIFWMTMLGKINSKTFHGVPALQEWFELTPETFVQR